MSKSNDLLGVMVIGAVMAAIIVAPNLYRQHKRLTEQQHEFMLIELKSLKSEYGVCEVINGSERKDWQDIMRDVCEKNLVRQAEVKKQLENY